MSAPINKLIDSIVKPCPKPENIEDGVPYATHTGTLQIGEFKLDCMVLNTGERIITKDSLEAAFGADFLSALSALHP